jgi:hypothetical protein
MKDGVCVVAALPASSVMPASCVEYGAYIAKCNKVSATDRDSIKKSFQEMEKILSSQSSEARESTAAEFDKACRTDMEATRSRCDTAPDPWSPSARSPEVAKLKDTVKFERIEWIVLSASEKGRRLVSNNMFAKSLTVDEGKFILVQFKVRNLTNTKATTEPPKLKDGKGRVFEPIEGHHFYVPDGKKSVGFLNEIPPGIATEFWEPYLVPDDSMDLLLLTHELDNDKPVKPVALGL